MVKVFTYTLFAVLVVDLLATAGDFHMTWASPIIPKLRSNDSNENPLGYPISKDGEEWLGSLVSIGAVIGPLPYSLLAESYGRKIALLAIAVHHIVCYVILAFSTNIYLFCAGRLLGGCAVGAGYTILPMYIAEVAEDSNRGMLSVTLNIFWTLGNLIPYAVGPYISIMWLNILCASVPAVSFVLLFFLVPETPYFLVKNDQMDKAEQSVKLLRRSGKDGIIREVDHIKSVLQFDKQGRVTDIFKDKVYLKALGISLILILAQQLSGINAILDYTEDIFSAAGVENIPPEISSMIIGLVMFVSSFVTPFFADSAGRKILMIISNLGIVFSFAALGTYYYLEDSTNVNVDPIYWLPIVSLVFYIVSYNIAVGPIPWTISSELFPSSVKSMAAGLTASTCWLTSFLTTRFFLDLTISLSDAGTFWLFGSCCLATAFYVMFFVPETKGKSFKEIQEILQ